jgi:hypothetical protein
MCVPAGTGWQSVTVAVNVWDAVVAGTVTVLAAVPHAEVGGPVVGGAPDVGVMLVIDETFDGGALVRVGAAVGCELQAAIVVRALIASATKPVAAIDLR